MADFGSFLLGPSQAFCGKTRLRWTHKITDGEYVRHTVERLDELDLACELDALADPDFELIEELEEGRAPLGIEVVALGLAAGDRHGCGYCPS